MSRKPIRLTTELSHEIVSAIRAGGYPHVAAEAFGVPKDLFDDWLKRGNEPNPWEPYRSFARDVRQAAAQARLRAEAEQLKKDPKLWLIHGPGRESEQRPGWSVSVRPTQTQEESRNVLLDPELMELLRNVVQALEPYPEARAHVSQVLSNAGVKTAA